MATGKHALGMCNRCGAVRKLNRLRKDGELDLLVCASCADIKHPAETPVDVSENPALLHPAPDLDATTSRVLDDDRPLGEVLGFTNYFGEQPE